MNTTLDQIMADDIEVYLKKNPIFGYDLEISSKDGEFEVKETQMHEYAIESLAEFCRRFLHDYDLANKE